MAKWNDNLLLKIVNVLVWGFLLGSNSFASVEGAGAGKITHITPAHYTFYVWTLINLLTLGLVIYQFFEDGYEPVVEGIGWRFAGVAILNALFAGAFSRGHSIVAFVIAIFLAVVLSHIYYTLQTIKPRTLGAKVFIHLPFSLWHAWSVVLLVLSLFAAFGKDKASHAGIFTDVFVCIALAFLASTSVGYAFSSGGKGDIAGAAVIAWALLGVYTAQHRPHLIHWFALGAFIVSAFAVIKALIFAFRTDSSILSNDSERAPLVAGN